MHRSQKKSELRQMIDRFEETLKQKIAQKGTAHQGEDAVLYKVFKYFDLNDDGTVNMQEFIKALEKVGIWIDNPKQANSIFNYYDVNANGGLDYYEFIGKVYRLSSKVPKHKMDLSGIVFRSKQHTSSQVERALNKINRKFQSRGNTVLDIAKHLKMVDEYGDRQIRYQEFKSALIEFKTGLSEEEMKMMFQYFDNDRSGVIDYDEFMNSLKGRITMFRQQIIDRVFDKLDRYGNGIVHIDDLEDRYIVDRHPEYMQGRKSRQQVLGDFVTNFDKYTSFRGIRDGKLNKEEFRDYYSYISSSIEDDQYFESMMVRCWRLDEPDYQQNRKTQTKGDTAKNLINDSNFVRYAKQELKQQTKPMSTEIGKQQISTMTQYQQQQQQQQYDQQQQGNTKTSNYKQRQQQQRYEQQRIEMKKQLGGQLMQQLIKKLRTRGLMSSFALTRSLRMANNDRSDELSFNEFSRCMKEFRVGFEDEEIKRVFRMFDTDRAGTINQHEFMKGVIGEMNNYRKNIVKTAYKKLDKVSRGYITISDIKGVYNAKRHPDVLQRKRTEEQVLMEFLETFETHYQNIKNDPSQRNSQISMNEFIDYYNNISISIDSDTYFEMVVRNGWNIDVDRIYPKPWKQND